MGCDAGFRGEIAAELGNSDEPPFSTQRAAYWAGLGSFYKHEPTEALTLHLWRKGGGEPDAPQFGTLDEAFDEGFRWAEQEFGPGDWGWVSGRLAADGSFIEDQWSTHHFLVA